MYVAECLWVSGCLYSCCVGCSCLFICFVLVFLQPSYTGGKCFWLGVLIFGCFVSWVCFNWLKFLNFSFWKFKLVLLLEVLL